MPGPGDEIAQGVTQGLTQFNPVTKGMGMAQQGGQQLIDLLMSLFAQQQQPPPPPVPFTGQMPGAPVPQGPGGGLRGKILGEY
jgi:hypothetical protein